jgi:hypothetical protein
VTKRVVLSALLMALGALAAIGGGALMAVFRSGNTLNSGVQQVSTPTVALVSPVAAIQNTSGVQTVVGSIRLRITATPTALTPAMLWESTVFGRHTPWGGEDQVPVVAPPETELERALAEQVMHGGPRPAVRELTAGEDQRAWWGRRRVRIGNNRVQTVRTDQADGHGRNPASCAGR